MDYGYTSPRWNANQIIKHCDPRLLRFAVIQLIDELHFREEHLCRTEITDRLVQVATTGSYNPPRITEEDLEASSEELEKEVQDFIDRIENPRDLDGDAV